MPAIIKLEVERTTRQVCLRVLLRESECIGVHVL